MRATIRCPPPVLVPLHPINRRRCVYFQTCPRPSYCTKSSGPDAKRLASFAFFGQFLVHSLSLAVAHSKVTLLFSRAPPWLIVIGIDLLRSNPQRLRVCKYWINSMTDLDHAKWKSFTRSFVWWLIEPLFVCLFILLLLLCLFSCVVDSARSTGDCYSWGRWRFI